MTRRKRKATFKSSELILLTLFLGLFLIFYILHLIASLLDYFISLSRDWNFFQWGYLVALCIGLFFSLHKYKLRKKNEQALIEKQKEREKLEKLKNAADLDNLKTMPHRDFEYYIADLFSSKGYEATVTSASGDGGKDIILRKDGYTSIVECKRYTTKKIGRPEIQKFHSALIDIHANEGFYVTTSSFANTAVKYVANKPINLIDGQQLINIISEINLDKSN
ncbi:hypothetical protein OKW24_003377 [Peribacillus simplex]|uniref:restriction endonuclease n=1 Tax=Peribacillus simplex TaxID=1478 RepID=UPI0024E2273C|nr:restriction endonuclease [Peribacillus simplex]MDF9761604.1 hypothetical protein [Peribacillus simplex]